MHSHPEAADMLIVDVQLYDGTGARLRRALSTCTRTTTRT